MINHKKSTPEQKRTLVKEEPCIYLFVGQDSCSKDIKLQNIKKDFLDNEFEDFNLDILYARELDLKSFQEKLLFLPLNAKRRIVVIRQAQDLNLQIKDFLIRYTRQPYRSILLILDVDQSSSVKDTFINNLLASRYVRVYYFKDILPPDTFTLSRQIDYKKSAYALRILNRLLKNGEKPERILGGLRYAWENDNTINSLERKRRLKILLSCDIDIKTGRLRPDLALEKLVVNLCAF